MNIIVRTILALLAKLTLWRYQPKVVAVTGSVGKTSTKEAVACVLKNKFKVRQSPGNYNNELGVPLTILEEESGGRSVIAWLGIFFRGFFKLISADYPDVLVLEFGADKPGDIGRLVSIVGNISIAAVTDIGISHLQFFANQPELVKEKLALIKHLKPQALAVLNFDSPKVFDGRTQTKAEVIGYGFSAGGGSASGGSPAQLLASDFHLNKFKLHYQGTVVPFFLPNALGKPAVYCTLAAVAVGLRFGMNLVSISEALKQYSPPAGRLRLIEGIKHTTIIDDTYNAAPSSTIAALEILSEIAIGRKVIALGAMTELGAKTDSGHREVAVKISESKVDAVFLVG